VSVKSLKLSSFLFLSGFLFMAPARANWWKTQTSGIDSNLRAVSAVYVPDSKANGAPVPVVWVSGSNGVILKSLDEGKTWQRLHVAEGDALDFRGIVAFDATTAYVMSIGEGDKSRIYKTTDGGETWKLQYSGDRKEIFLDSIACLAEKVCFALGDPVERKFLLLKTTDGAHWNALPTDNMPGALPGEGAFAASNSCLALPDDNEIFFGTGGPAARVFHSSDGGLTWTVARTPVLQGNLSSGVFSLRADNRDRVLVLGGDYKDGNKPDRAAAMSLDHGKTWQLAARQPGGFRSGLAQIGIGSGDWVAVGPSGEDVSQDYGVHWKHTDTLNLNAVCLLDTQVGWAVGPKGTVARFVNHFQYNVRVHPSKTTSVRGTSGIAD
jgi:photosystem II stability/assembly factor-like uncharacterized protein